jgi:hypothetical protein
LSWVHGVDIDTVNVHGIRIGLSGELILSRRVLLSRGILSVLLGVLLTGELLYGLSGTGVESNGAVVPFLESSGYLGRVHDTLKESGWKGFLIKRNKRHLVSKSGFGGKSLEFRVVVFGVSVPHLNGLDFEEGFFGSCYRSERGVEFGEESGEGNSGPVNCPIG